MGKKSSKTTSGPSAAALPYLNQATSAVTSANTANQGNLNNIDNLLQNNMGSVASNALNNPTLAAAGNYDQSLLSGDPLNNPLLKSILGQTDAATTDAVNGGIGTRGLTGGSAQAQLLASEIAKANNNTVFNAQAGAANNATSVAGAQNSGLNSLLQYLTTQAGLPTSGADDLATQIQKLWGNSTTTTSTPSFLQSLEGLISAGSSAVTAATGGKGV